MTPYSVAFASDALDDLVKIYHHIAEQGYPDTAKRYTDDIVAYCEKLDIFPHGRGVDRKDIRPGLRLSNYKHTLEIAFAVDDVAKTVSIVRLFYGGQDYCG